MAATIRPAAVGDAEEIAAVHVASWRWAYRNLLGQTTLDSLSVEARADGWRQWFDDHDPRGSSIVAEDRGKIVGFVGCGPAEGEEPTCGEIHAIYLLESSTRRGIGRELLGAATRSLLEAGFDRAILWTLEGNDRAIGFYEHEGWALDGSTETYEIGGRPMPIVRLSRVL